MKFELQRKAILATATPAAVAANWQSRGFSCQRFSDPPGREWSDFVHEANELVTVLEGRLELTVGDATLVVEAGDEVFIPRGAYHSVKNIHHGTTRWLFGYDATP